MLPNPLQSLSSGEAQENHTNRGNQVPVKAMPFNPNAPLSRRSFVESPKEEVKQASKTNTETNTETKPIATKDLVVKGLTDARPMGSPVPLNQYPEFADIRSPWWPTSLEFLRRFKASLLTYIPDGENPDTLPILHTYGVDGITPLTTAFPDPDKQNQGYGMFFSVNGLKNNKSRKADNLYCLNAFFADIDWPDKKNPPTNSQMRAFKQAVYEDLTFCIASGREAFVEDPKQATVAPGPSAIVETKNGFHVYWLLDQPFFLGRESEATEGRDEAVLREYRKAHANIISRFQADPQCIDPVRVLRVPDSYHLKNPAEPFQIKLRYFEPENVYSFEQMIDFWVHNPHAVNPSYAYHHAEEFKRKVTRDRAERLTSPRKDAPSGPFKPAGLSVVDGLGDADLAALDAAYPILERPSFLGVSSPVGIPEGERNKTLLIAASLLRRSGASEESVVARFGGVYNDLSPYEIKATIRSAYTGAKPYDFGWNDEVLSKYVTLEEAARVKSIIKELYENKKRSNRGKRVRTSEEGESISTDAVESVHEDERTGRGGDLDSVSRHNDEGERCEDALVRGRDTGDDGGSGGGGNSQDFEGRDQKNTRNPFDLSEAAVLTLANIKELEGQFSIIDRPTQKRLYNVFDRIFAQYHPDIVSVDDVGFFWYDAKKHFYSPITEDGIRRMVSEDLLTLGCLDMRATGNVSAKVESLQAFRPIRMSREESEAVLMSDGRNGTIVNTLSGLVDLDSGTLLPEAKRLFVTSALPVTFDPSIPRTSDAFEVMCPLWMKFLREIAVSGIPGESENKLALLQEMAGYCFTPYTFFQTAFILLGTGSNGKSTFLDTVRDIIGQEDTSTLKLEDLSSQFGLGGLYRKRMNVTEEISNNYFESDNLKKIISGQEITADRKFMQPIRFKPTAKLIFALNSFPRVNDQSHALYRRFKTISFNRTFDETSKDVMLPQKLWEERNGIFAWAMQGWQRLKLTGKFTHSIEAFQSGEDFKEQNSPLVEFILKECLLYEEVDARKTPNMPPVMKEDYIVPIDSLYAAYRAFAKDNGYGPKAHQGFMKEMTTLTHSRLRHVCLAPSLGRSFIGLRFKPTFSGSGPSSSFWGNTGKAERD